MIYIQFYNLDTGVSSLETVTICHIVAEGQKYHLILFSFLGRLKNTTDLQRVCMYHPTKGTTNPAV